VEIACLALIAAGIASAVPAWAADKEEEAEQGPFDQLVFRYIGPPGNRLSAVVGVPGDPNVFYAGAASGGVWKATDGGTRWDPIFDDQPAQSIGAIAIAPSDPNVIWVGTGESFIRSNVSIGNGVYKSTDAGKTWTHMGLEQTGRIPRVIIDPRNPDVVFVAALGTCYGPQPERGVFRTTNGGATWEKVLFVDENTGVSDLAMDPTNPRILFAGTWQIDIKTWGRQSGGPGSGVYVSRDGGTSWKQLTGNGLPEPPLGKIAVAVAASDPQRVYALIETGHRGSLWRSDDGGGEWKKVNDSRLLNERPHYYTRMLVMPDDANEVYFPSNSMGVTYDGGETAEQVEWGGDNHDMWADPENPSRMMIASDVGVLVSTTRGRSWARTRLPIAQMYHVSADSQVPYHVYGQMQDGRSQKGPSRNPGGWSIPPSLWTTTAGCETGWATPDPVDPDIVWGGCYAGVVERFDARTGMSRSVSPWPERTMGANAGEIRLRMNWTHPLVISPHDHNVVYVGSQYVHQTSDGGQTWKTISPDLTLNDPSMMGDSGGLTLDNLSVEYAGTVFSIAESPLAKGEIWAGTNDGLIQLTRDGGENWSNVTPPSRLLPPKGTVSSLEPSRFAEGTCYAAVDLHQVDDRDPYILVTRDWGKSWKAIQSDIPTSPLSYVHVVREDPFRQGLLYAGTENALYVSFDDGGSWEPLQNKLPHAPVHWLTIQPQFHDLVVGTYGRGFYILDDVTPLEQWTEEVRSAPLHLFDVLPAYRFRATAQPVDVPSSTAHGDNPPYGALINYWLKEPIEEESDDEQDDHADDARYSLAEDVPLVKVTVFDEAGTKVRSLRGTNKEGVNRVAWDLRWDPTEQVHLRSIPGGNPHVWLEKRFRGRDALPVLYYGVGDRIEGPLVTPGTYTVKVEAGGTTVSKTVDVKKDPRSGTTDADVAASAELSYRIHKDIDETARMINKIEWTRRQLDDLEKMWRAAGADASLEQARATLEKEALAVEEQLMQPSLAEADQKSFRGAIKLYLQLVWLQAEVGTGRADVSGGADMAPTQPELEVYGVLHERLEKARADFRKLYDETIPAFNEEMKEKGLLRLIPVEEVQPEYPKQRN
jgi:photosystem II stability/assembly factor-like uncharacterized protein